MTKETGGPAFPAEVSPDPEMVKALREGTGMGLMDCRKLLSKHSGMSLRDWFAGQALAGRMARNSTYRSWSNAAADAYEAADAMLAEREKGQ